MKKYYVNKNAQSNGDHEVHEENCPWLKMVVHKEYLGEFYSCHGAVEVAKRRGYSKANGCKHCSEDCDNQN